VATPMLLNYQIGSYNPSPSSASLNPSVRLDQIEIESRSGLKTYDYVPITPESLDRAKVLDKGASGADVNNGVNNTKPNQVHHYVTNKNKTYTSQFENITKKYKLDLDGKWNKDFLPHQGRHPNEYHDYMLDNLQKIDKLANGDKTKFLKLYEQLKNRVKTNPDMLYKDFWKKKYKE